MHAAIFTWIQSQQRGFGVSDKDVVEVAVNSNNGRDLVFGDVLVRVSPKYVLEMHIDTDEANAAEIRNGGFGRATWNYGEGEFASSKGLEPRIVLALMTDSSPK